MQLHVHLYAQYLMSPVGCSTLHYDSTNAYMLVCGLASAIIHDLHLNVESLGHITNMM